MPGKFDWPADDEIDFELSDIVIDDALVAAAGLASEPLLEGELISAEKKVKTANTGEEKASGGQYDQVKAAKTFQEIVYGGRDGATKPTKGENGSVNAGDGVVKPVWADAQKAAKLIKKVAEENQKLMMENQRLVMENQALQAANRNLQDQRLAIQARCVELQNQLRASAGENARLRADLRNTQWELRSQRSQLDKLQTANNLNDYY